MTSTLRLTGIVPPIATPFTADGDIDVPSLRRTVDHLVEGGVHGIFALGSTAEVAYLDDAQRELVLRTVVETAAGRVPVVAAAIEMTTRRVQQAVAAAAAIGVDGVVVTAPFYALPDAGEIEAHFRAVAAASPVPVYAYDVPVRVHSKLGADMLVRLGSEGVIAGVKDSSGDDVGFRRLVAANAAAGSPLALLTGHEVVVDGMLLLGADGVVPGLANVDPQGYSRLWDAAQAGDWAQVRVEQDRIAALFEIVFQSPERSLDARGVGAFKVAMALQGICDTPMMAYPVQPIVGPAVERITEIVRAAGLTVVTPA
ncbi:dihydrodipicolinate synthase family protein [Sanguibacter sp. HDW7]|uniref:dihydrodipicolinate synthase family protein n=1 Tax=Sanguibacter sp. HDW7 TaxID=2714931 RepID=UPI00140B0B0E|nr:dihydrodipicolinate synthase family protein [Sanguibacter sp. HDW7]QIK84239.1 dihydrodipicolinate synthase family protein [Sanguibacter sp. HDW7]